MVLTSRSARGKSLASSDFDGRPGRVKVPVQKPRIWVLRQEEEWQNELQEQIGRMIDAVPPEWSGPCFFRHAGLARTLWILSHSFLLTLLAVFRGFPDPRSSPHMFLNLPRL